MGEAVRVVTSAETPWIDGNLRIKRAVIAAVEADALRGYAADEEACGYLRGPAADPLLCDGHVMMPNVANKLHAVDPERWFRTAREYFAFNEKKFDDAVRASASEGTPVKVLYHSHLDTGAYFSPTDAAVMSFGEPPAVEGGPITMGPGPQWPLAFLVTSVQKGAIAEHRLFVWSHESRSFVASPFSVVD
jgi:[CysO sulfur-carrier protein]-S-L-cysteine hydrolase